MPAQVQQSVSFVSVLGTEFAKIHDIAKNVKVESQGNTLPDGLRGIAQLRWIGLKRIEKGENTGRVMFYADATILEPESFGGLKVKGKRTFISEPLYDTPKRKRPTVQDHVMHMYAVLKMLGVNTELLKPNQMDAAVASLLKKKPFIAFRTWQPPAQTSGPYAGKASQMLHFWDETVDYKKPDAMASAVNVDLPPVVEEPTTDVEESNGTAPDATGYAGVYDDTHSGTFPTNSGGTGNEGTTETVSKMDNGMASDTTNESTTIEELAKLATVHEYGAINELTNRALALGITQKQIDDSESWDKLVEEMRNRIEASGNAKPEPEPDGTPINVGDKFNYKPLNPATKTKHENAIGVEVVGLNGETGTVDLRSLVNRKIVYKNISVDELEDVT